MAVPKHAAALKWGRLVALQGALKFLLRNELRSFRGFVASAAFASARLVRVSAAM